MRAGGRAGIERHFDFGHGGAIEVGAHGGEQLQDFRRRVCLDGIVDRAVRQGMTERLEIVAHDIEVDHEAGAVGTSGVRESRGCAAVVISQFPHPDSADAPGKHRRTKGKRDDIASGTSRWRPRNQCKRIDARMLNQRRESGIDPALSAMDWRDDPNRTSGNEGVPLQ